MTRQHARLSLGLLVALSGLALGTSQCIWGTDEPWLAAEDLPALQLLEAIPSADASGVALNARPGARFDDRVHPDSLQDGAAQLLEGTAEVPAAPFVDLIDCAVTVRPATDLAPSTTYTMRFEGLHGFETSALAEPGSVTITTGAGLDPVPERTPPTFAEVYDQVIGPRCASCHRAFRPPLGLDLSSPEAAEMALWWDSSVDRPERPYVTPGDHASSYVMWKVLGLPGTPGEAMPPDGDWPSDRACRTSDPGLRALADWIDALEP